MIVRIELNQLENRSNYYSYNDILFTGEAYDHRDNQLYQVYEITDGEITGSRDYGFFETNGMIKVDYDLLQSGENFDYEMNQLPYYFQGQPFTGVMYEYRFSFVLSEAIFINSWLIEHISFYPDGTGRIRLYEKNDIDPTETTGDRTWYLESENNSLKSIESRYLDFQDTNHTGYLKLLFNDKEQINRVIIEDDFAYVSLLVPRDDLELGFKTFDDLLAKQNIFADNLSIWSIEDALFNQWLDQGLLNQVKQLELYKTKIELSTIARLIKLPSLERLNYQESSLYPTDLVHAEEQQYRAQALALFALQQNSNIKITFTDGRVDFFQTYLPDELKQQLPKQE